MRKTTEPILSNSSFLGSLLDSDSLFDSEFLLDPDDPSDLDDWEDLSPLTISDLSWIEQQRPR